MMVIRKVSIFYKRWNCEYEFQLEICYGMIADLEINRTWKIRLR